MRATNVVPIDHFELDILVSLELVADDKAFFEVRIEVILHDFSLIYFAPCLLRHISHKHYAYGVRDAINNVHVSQFAA
jgi:hypothetical protein